VGSYTFGILLAGGLARRMGGGDKGLRRIGGRTILERVIETMRPQCAGLVLNANGDAGRLAAFGLPVVPDNVPGFAGPLAGVLAGLDWVAAHHPDIEFAVSVPTDTPFLPADLVSRLSNARAEEEGADLACAMSGGATHPVVALWPVEMRKDLRRALVEEEIRKVGYFLKSHRVAYADWSTVPLDPFFNANEPQDLEAAEAFLARA
jgi:molybdopterin-guanine dinucleotide biosynthesis protein A